MLTRLGLELLYLPLHRTLELQTIPPPPPPKTKTKKRENSNKIIYKLQKLPEQQAFGWGGPLGGCLASSETRVNSNRLCHVIKRNLLPPLPPHHLHSLASPETTVNSNRLCHYVMLQKGTYFCF
jgi:hypothetical protein